MTGFLILKKPKDITSFLAVSKCRRLFETKKVGHSGTLDPMATGVLVIAIGNSTRFLELLPSHNKAYVAEFVLGFQTDTLDITGNVINKSEEFCEKFDKAETERKISLIIPEFVGKINRLPPMFSAIKRDGKRLYELARRGIEVERKSREVEIFSLELLECEKPDSFRIFVECSSGTYIRTLIDDIGKKLGTFATMTELERVEANGTKIENAFSFEELENLKEGGKLESALLSVEKMLGYEKIFVSDARAKRFSNGGELDLKRVRQIKAPGLYCVFSNDGEFCGVGNANFETGLLEVKRVFVKETPKS